jgi:rhodanese-related sulfurtransferase
VRTNPPVAVAHHHNPGFLALVEEAKSRVRTFSIEEFVQRLQAGERFVLLDNREDLEWERGHLPGAYHMSKGIIERDIETAIPDRGTPIVCYCGGGFRSVLVADNLRRMGYTNVLSLDGGWRGWNERGLPTVKPEPAPR